MRAKLQTIDTAKRGRLESAPLLMPDISASTAVVVQADSVYAPLLAQQQHEEAAGSSDTANGILGISSFLDKFEAISICEAGGGFELEVQPARLQVQVVRVPFSIGLTGVPFDGNACVLLQVSRWLWESAASCTDLLREKHVQLRLSRGSDVPAEVLAEGSKLYQVRFGGRCEKLLVLDCFSCSSVLPASLR